MPYGWKIKEILKEKEMTQAELSRITGIKPSNLSYIVNNNRDVLETTLERLCYGLECRPEDIMLNGKERR